MIKPENPERSRSLRELPGAVALPAAVAVSFVLSVWFEADWSQVFSSTLLAFGLAEGVWRWFAAPEEPAASPDLTPPQAVVPREAKLGAITAAAILGAVLLAVWIA